MLQCLVAISLWNVAAALTAAQRLVAPAPPGVVELFEDDVDGLLKLLTNPGDAPGKGEAENKVVFSGRASLKVSEYQCFQRQMPGWDYPIRQKPGFGEYRYLRLAWKADGASSMMVQLHDATDWHIRYTAGPNPYGWTTRFVADKAPAVWTLATLDLFKDFGERNLTGIAFTIHGGAGYFDHVYLGRTVEDLDLIDATGLAKQGPLLDKQDLGRLWRELSAEDAARQYRAFWMLVAGGERSAAFIKERLAPAQASGPKEKEILEWIHSLDANMFTVRQKATAELKKNLRSAAPLLEAELARSQSAEVRRRITTLLAGLAGRDIEQLRRAKAQRALDAIAARQSRNRRLP